MLAFRLHSSRRWTALLAAGGILTLLGISIVTSVRVRVDRQELAIRAIEPQIDAIVLCAIVLW